MKQLLRLLTAIAFTSIVNGCAIYASPYGYTPGYYDYAPYYGVGFSYWPRSYYSYRPYHHYWGGHRWGGGGHHWGGHYGGWRGGGGYWGGRGGWHHR